MPCYHCGARQTDPVRGASPWLRGVSDGGQVLICPDCQGAADLRLDTCDTCGSTRLVCRLGEVECRDCGAERPAARSAAGVLAPTTPPGLSAEVEAALNRVLGRN
ncbi:hypothetical protein [Spongiactinospora sp. 9N601]|uniref:hypothetical protein n=1 Tax=Spongiactinospora sp. 9N601 TaxID=3375149 RepID=UPI00379A6075